MNVAAHARRLREEREAVVQALSHLRAGVAVSQRDAGGEMNAVDQHVADVASETEARELDEGRRVLLEDRLRSIDEALARIERGTYGRCVVCGERIAEERLEALPDTPSCLRHAARRAGQVRRAS